MHGRPQRTHIPCIHISPVRESEEHDTRFRTGLRLHAADTGSPTWSSTEREMFKRSLYNLKVHNIK